MIQRPRILSGEWWFIWKTSGQVSESVFLYIIKFYCIGYTWWLFAATREGCKSLMAQNKIVNFTKKIVFEYCYAEDTASQYLHWRIIPESLRRNSLHPRLYSNLVLRKSWPDIFERLVQKDLLSDLQRDQRTNPIKKSPSAFQYDHVFENLVN